MKPCVKCGESFVPPTPNWVAKRGWICKECRNRVERGYDRRAYLCQYMKQESYKVKRRVWQKKYNQRPDVQARLKVHRKIEGAIRAGKLERQPCAECGKTPAEGHHEDYSKPFDITWLCGDHHRELHSKRRRKA